MATIILGGNFVHLKPTLILVVKLCAVNARSTSIVFVADLPVLSV